MLIKKQEEYGLNLIVGRVWIKLNSSYSKWNDQIVNNG